MYKSNNKLWKCGCNSKTTLFYSFEIKLEWQQNVNVKQYSGYYAKFN